MSGSQASDNTAARVESGEGIFDPARLPASYFEDPYALLAELRESAPVYWCPDGSLYLTRHADLFSVYRDPRTFSSDKRVQFKPLLGDSPLYDHHTTSLVFNDPPLHTRVRRAFGNALSPRAVAAMRPWVEQLVERLLDGAQAKGEFDLVEDFAAAIPIEVIGNLLRIPESERGPLRAWSLAILGALEFKLTPERLAEGNQAVTDFLALLDDLVWRRRESLTDDEDDLLARLLRFEADGVQLRGAALYHQIVFLLNAGHETTTNLISNGALALLAAPEALTRLQADPSGWGLAVEELLRYEAPIQLNNRRSVTPTCIGGIDVPAGTNITMNIAAANRDPAVFDAPDALDLRRNPNPHLCFGSGIHTCAGLHVARLEGEVALAALFRRFPDLTPCGPAVRARRARFRVILHAPMATGIVP
ncbi:MAG: cytochrome P450 [Pseudomonadota bacterium]